MATSAINGNSSASSSSTGSPNDVLRDVDLSQFLKLMITELQNQDPLSPMENHQILQQISQIREIEATDRLGTTLESVLLGQSISSASVLIGKQVNGLSEAGNEVSGTVERVSLYNKQATLHIGDEQIRLTNVREVVQPTAEPEQDQVDLEALLQSLLGQGSEAAGV